MHDVNVIVTEDYVDGAIRAVKQDMKVWMMGSILTSAVTLALPMAGVVFYLGTMNSKLDTAFAVQTEQQAILANRGEWIERRERVEESLVAWARREGYEPPEPVR